MRLKIHLEQLDPILRFWKLREPPRNSLREDFFKKKLKISFDFFLIFLQPFERALSMPLQLEQKVSVMIESTRLMEVATIRRTLEKCLTNTSGWRLPTTAIIEIALVASTMASHCLKRDGSLCSSKRKVAQRRLLQTLIEHGWWLTSASSSLTEASRRPISPALVPILVTVGEQTSATTSYIPEQLSDEMIL